MLRRLQIAPCSLFLLKTTTTTSSSSSTITRTRILSSSTPCNHRNIHITTSLNMPKNSYIVTAKDSASKEDVERLKQQIKDQGGEITHEYTLIKGFACKFPEGHVHALDSHEHVKHVEEDGEVRAL